MVERGIGFWRQQGRCDEQPWLQVDTGREISGEPSGADKELPSTSRGQPERERSARHRILQTPRERD
jgi:hypothetical protein